MSRRKRPPSTTQPGVQMALTTTPTSVLIPSASGIGYAKAIRVSSVSAACVRVGQAGDVATATDCLVQAGDAVKLNAMGCTHVSARGLTGATVLSITPLDEGDWVPGAVVDVDLRSGLPSDWTFARTSAATRINTLGLVETVAANIPRFDYDPVTLTSRGLLMEAQGTNLATWSADFTNGNWALLGSASRGPTASRANPDGAGTATQVNLAAGGDMVRQIVAGITAATNYTVSVWARKAVVGGATNLRITTNNTAAWNTGFSQAFALTNQWQRLSVTGQIASGTSMYAMFGAVDATSASDASCVGSVELWGAQVELGSQATSYIPTTAAGATRAAETCRVSLGAWFNPNAGTLVSEYQTAVPANGRFVWYLANAGRTGLQPALRSNENVIAGSISFTPNYGGTGVQKVALAMANADWASVGTADLNAVNTNTTQAIQTDMASLALGEDGNGGLQLNGWLRRLTYYACRLPNTALRALTA